MRTFRKSDFYVLSIIFITSGFFACKPTITVSQNENPSENTKTDNTTADIKTADTTAPASVTELKAVSGDGIITLTWKDPTDEDLYAIKINQVVETPSRAAALTEGILVQKGLEKFEITNLIDQKSYVFKVSALDTSLNESSVCATEPVVFSVTKEPEVNKDGLYKVYHLQQNITGGKAFYDYVVFETEEDKAIEKGSRLDSLKNTYAGFTAKSMAQNENSIYIFYDRNLITYTFDAGTEGAFENTDAVKTVSGLFGSKLTIPKNPASEDYRFVEWDTSINLIPETFGSENLVFSAIWSDQLIPPGFVLVKETTYDGTEEWTAKNANAKSKVFISGRTITVSDLLVCDHEVTRREYTAIMGTDPSTAAAYDKDENLLEGDAALENPVNNVSWYDAIIYCNELSKKENLTPCYSLLIDGADETDTSKWGKIPAYGNDLWNSAKCDWTADGYRLPTEAEWEWACRGGEVSYLFSGSNTLNDVGWYKVNTSETGSRTVKQKDPNAFGIYDMSGNLSELCWDWYDTIDATTPATGPESSPKSGTEVTRVKRGGSWSLPDYYSYAGFRMETKPFTKNNVTGFRVVRKGFDDTK